jgi:hypothetical protein
VAVVANDATVKGGTYFPITVKARPGGTWFLGFTQYPKPYKL